MDKTLVSEAYVWNGKAKIEEIPQRDKIIPPRWDDFGAFLVKKWAKLLKACPAAG